MKEHLMFLCLALHLGATMAFKCLSEDTNHYKIEYDDSSGQYRLQMTEFQERCLEHKFEIVDASNGIDYEKELEIDENTAEFKIGVYENDDHHFSVRMTTADGLEATSPQLHASRRKLGHVDCNSYINVPTVAEYHIQKDSTADIPSFAATTTHVDCPVLSLGIGSYEPCAIVQSTSNKLWYKEPAVVVADGECTSSETCLSNTQVTLLECQQNVLDAGGQFFIWSVTGNGNCFCYQEHTTDASCPEGFKTPVNGWNFYQIDQTEDWTLDTTTECDASGVGIFVQTQEDNVPQGDSVYSSRFRINVFDCLQHITFPNLRNWNDECQMFGTCGTASVGHAWFCMDGSASTASATDCPLSSATYSATSSRAGFTVDTTSGRVCWETTTAQSTAATVQISVVVGSQTKTSSVYTFNYVDCTSLFTKYWNVDTNYYYKVGEIASNYFYGVDNALAATGQVCEITALNMRYNNNQSSFAMTPSTGGFTATTSNKASFTDGVISLSTGFQYQEIGVGQRLSITITDCGDYVSTLGADHSQPQLVKQAVECSSAEIDMCTSSSTVFTLTECGQAVENNGGQFFIWKTDTICRCYQEYTSSSSCSEGWYVIEWGFYTIANQVYSHADWVDHQSSKSTATTILNPTATTSDSGLCPISSYAISSDNSTAGQTVSSYYTLNTGNGQVSILKNEVFKLTNVVLTVTSGTQSWRTNPITIEVISCDDSSKITKPTLLAKYNFQLNSTSAAATVDMTFTFHDTTNCPLDGGNLLYSPARGADGLFGGIGTVTASSGSLQVNFNTASAYNTSSLYVYLTSNGEQIQSTATQVEIYDCTSFVAFPTAFTDMTVQIGSPAIDITTTTPHDPSKCLQSGDFDDDCCGKTALITCNDDYHLTQGDQCHTYSDGTFAYYFTCSKCLINNVVVLDMPSGTTMNQTHLETNVVASVTNAKIEAQVGSQYIHSTSHQITFYDCTEYITWPTIPSEYRIQKGAASQSVVLAPTTNDTTLCPLGAIVVNNLVAPITPGNNANFTIPTDAVYTATGVQISLTVGYQTFLSTTFDVIVYDCSVAITFPTFANIKEQMLSTDTSFIGKATTTDAVNCPVVTGQTTITNFPTAHLPAGYDGFGNFVVIKGAQFVQSNISSTIVVGSQTVTSNTWSLEVFDCTPHVSWPSLPDIKVQVDSATVRINSQILSTDTRYCPRTGTHQVTNLPSVGTVNTAGSMVIQTAEAHHTPSMFVTVPVGSQTYTSTTWAVLIIDCIPKMTWNLAPSYLLQVGKAPMYVENWITQNDTTDCAMNSYTPNTFNGLIKLNATAITIPEPEFIDLHTASIGINIGFMGSQNMRSADFTMEVRCTLEVIIYNNSELFNQTQYGFEFKFPQFYTNYQAWCPVEDYLIAVEKGGPAAIPNGVDPKGLYSQKHNETFLNYTLEAQVEYVQQMSQFYINVTAKGKTNQEFGPYNFSICPKDCKEWWESLDDQLKSEEYWIDALTEASRGLFLFQGKALSDSDRCPFQNLQLVSSNPAVLLENPETFKYDAFVTQTNLEDDKQVNLLMDTQSQNVPEEVKQYNLLVKTAPNCFGQTKVLNFTVELKLMPKFLKYPPSNFVVLIGKTNEFSLGVYQPLSTEFDISITTVAVSESYTGKGNLRKQIVPTDKKSDTDFAVEINLEDVEKGFAGSSFSLEIQLKVDEKRSYTIQFTLGCQGDDLECLDPEAWAAQQEKDRLADEDAKKGAFEGIDLAAREAELARLALLKKYAHLPEPQLKISKITPFGGFDIKFNQDMNVPSDWKTFDYSNVFYFQIDSALVRGLIVEGEFVKNIDTAPPSKKKRVLQEDDEDLSEEDKIKAQLAFQWYVSNHDPQALSVKFIFDNPTDVSASGEGSDQLGFRFKDKEYFQNPLSKRTIDQKLYDQVAPQKIPLIIADLDTAASIGAGAEAGGQAATAAGIGSLLISILLGGSMEQLWGLLNTMQIIIFGCLINVEFPWQAGVFFDKALSFAKMDVLSGEQYYTDNFEFIETPPYNSRFEAMGYETMTFAINSGSFTLILFIMIIFGLIKKVLHRIACRFRHYKIFRLLGIRCQHNAIFAPSVRLLFETYLEIFICSTFGILDLVNSGRSWSDNFSQPGYAMNSGYVIVFGFIALTLPFWAVRKVYINFHRLDDPEFEEEYGSLFEDLKTDDKFSVMFHMIFLLRRMIAVGAFIFLEDYGYAQAMIMTVMSFMNLWILIGNKPFLSDYTNKVEFANEIVVYITQVINMCFVNEAVPLSARTQLAYVMILVCLMNVGQNLGLVIKGTIGDLKDQWKQTKDDYYLKKEFDQTVKEAKQYVDSSDAKRNGEYKDKIKILQLKEAKLYANEWLPQRKWLKANGFKLTDHPEELKFRAMSKISNLQSMAKKKKMDSEKAAEQQIAQETTIRQKSILRAQQKMRQTQKGLKVISKIQEDNYKGQDEKIKKKDYTINSKTGVLRFKKTFKKALKKGSRNKEHNDQLTVIREEPEQEFDSMSQVSENNEIKDIVDPEIVKQAVAARKKQVLQEFIASKITGSQFSTNSGHIQNANNIQELVNELDGVYHEEINVFANPGVQASVVERLMQEDLRDEDMLEEEAIKEYEAVQLNLKEKIEAQKALDIKVMRNSPFSSFATTPRGQNHGPNANSVITQNAGTSLIDELARNIGEENSFVEPDLMTNQGSKSTKISGYQLPVDELELPPENETLEDRVERHQKFQNGFDQM